MMQLPTRIPLLTAAFGLSAVWLGAEPSPAVPPDEEILSLDRFVVTDVPVEDSINPLVRPMQSVFGEKSCYVLSVRSAGGTKVTIE